MISVGMHWVRGFTLEPIEQFDVFTNNRYLLISLKIYLLSYKVSGNVFRQIF